MNRPSALHLRISPRHPGVLSAPALLLLQADPESAKPAIKPLVPQIAMPDEVLNAVRVASMDTTPTPSGNVMVRVIRIAFRLLADTETVSLADGVVPTRSRPGASIVTREPTETPGCAATAVHDPLPSIVRCPARAHVRSHPIAAAGLVPTATTTWAIAPSPANRAVPAAYRTACLVVTPTIGVHGLLESGRTSGTGFAGDRELAHDGQPYSGTRGGHEASYEASARCQAPDPVCRGSGLSGRMIQRRDVSYRLH